MSYKLDSFFTVKYIFTISETDKKDIQLHETSKIKNKDKSYSRYTKSKSRSNGMVSRAHANIKLKFILFTSLSPQHKSFPTYANTRFRNLENIYICIEKTQWSSIRSFSKNLETIFNLKMEALFGINCEITQLFKCMMNKGVEFYFLFITL